MIIGDSMKPTFYNFQPLCFTKNTKKLKKGDVVVFKLKNETYIKRIVGVTNDIYYLQKMNPSFYSLSDDEFENKNSKKLIKILQFKKIPKDNFFVQGDNLSNSVDSRNYGLIDRSKIIGKLYK